MIIPVRCFSCNKIIGNKYEKYKLYISNNLTSEQAFKELKIDRYCCKRMLLSHKDFIDNMIKHECDFDYVKVL